jgi:hypothetical protein
MGSKSRTRKEVSRLARQARELDLADELSSSVCQLIRRLGLELPCEVTVNDGTTHLRAVAERGSRTYGKDTPDEAFMIHVRVFSEQE